MHRRNVLAGLIVLPGIAHAHSYRQATIAIGHAWALPAGSGDGQLFAPLVNNGQKPDALVAARSSICTLIELRRNNRYDDPALDSFPLDPGRPLPMRPTARHLRLVNIKQPLASGSRFSLILDFLHAGEIEIEAMVETAPGD